MRSATKPHVPRKKSQIVDAAVELSAGYGFRKLTVEEICSRAGVSKMTFYKYFPNKLALFAYIWKLWLDEGLEYLRSVDGLDIPFTEKLQRIVEFKVQFVSRIRGAAIDEVLSADPEMSALLQAMMRKSHETVSAWLVAAQERGDMRRMKPELFLAAIEKMRELSRDPKLRALYPDDGDFVREINSFMFFGVLPPWRGGARRR